jgi:hypothetical protein
LTKNGLGHILGDFVANSSSSPAREALLHGPEKKDRALWPAHATYVHTQLERWHWHACSATCADALQEAKPEKNEENLGTQFLQFFHRLLRKFWN